MPVDIEQYHHVAWGMCHTLSKSAQHGVPADAKNGAAEL
jgi:hypothetical protein